MEFGYSFNDAQNLLGSLGSNGDEFQLTSNNLYQNEGLWANDEGNNGEEAADNGYVKQEYISPSSLNQNYYSSSEANTVGNGGDDKLLSEIINFENEDSSLFVPADSDDIESQIDELIQSSTQVPTPESSTGSGITSPTFSQQSQTLTSKASSVSAINSSGNKVAKPKKSRSTHNAIEKKYRTNINSKIIELRDAVPALRIASDSNQATTLDDLEGLTPAAKLNKASILTKATEYIKHLENKNDMLSNEVFQLRHVLSQFQQLLPQVAPSQQPYPQMSQHQLPSPQHSSNQVPLSQHSSPMQQQPAPQQHQQQQQQQQQQPQPQQQQQQQQQQAPPARTRSGQSFTDQVNMGLNGFVPTLHQIQTAHLQLQNLQQNGGAAQQQPQHQHQQQQQHQQGDNSMSFGNKLLVGGMTTLLGSQIFAGGADGDGYDYKGLSFIPIHKLFPALNTDAGQFVVNFFRIVLVLFSTFTLLEPVIYGILSRFNKDAKAKQLPHDNLLALTVAKSYSQVLATKLGLKDPIDQLDKITAFNELIANKVTTALEGEAVAQTWKEVLLDFSRLELFYIPDTVSEKDVNKRNEVVSVYIETLFTKLVIAKAISIKLGTMLSSIIGMNKTVDSTMLKIIKLNKLIDVDTCANDKVLRIKNLVDTETDFINSAHLFDTICDTFRLSRDTFFKTLIWSSDSSAASKVDLTDLVNSTEPLSLINLIVTIRTQEAFDGNLVKYARLNLRLADSSDSESDDSSYSSSASNDDDETDTEPETREEVVKGIYDEIVRFEKLIPASSFKLAKNFKFFKALIKPNGKDLNSIVSLLKTEACELIDYYGSVETKDSQNDQLSKIKEFASSKSGVSKQHSAEFGSLISEDNHLLLTCSFILYYHSIGKPEECFKLINFLKISPSLSLLSFIALFETSNVLIKELLKKEDSVLKSLNATTTKAEEEEEDDDDDSSSTIDLDHNKVLESRLRSIDHYKSSIEQLILKSRLIVSQQKSFNELLDLNLKSEVSDKLVKMGKRINGYD